MSSHVVNTHEAKSRLSELIRAAESGDEVIVARNGRPVAKIIPWPQPSAERTPGAWAGKVTFHDDVVETDIDVLAMFDESAQS